MPGMDGMAVLAAAKRRDPNIEVIVMTAYGSVESAVEAMKKGAYDYLTKPINLEELRLKVRGALEKQKLALRVEDLEQQLDDRYGFEDRVGTSDKIRRVYERVRQVAPSRSTVLITGYGQGACCPCDPSEQPEAERAVRTPFWLRCSCERSALRTINAFEVLLRTRWTR